DEPERGLGFSTLPARIAQILVQHKQAQHHLTHLPIPPGTNGVVGDRAPTGANLGGVHKEAIGRAVTRPWHAGSPRSPRRESREYSRSSTPCHTQIAAPSRASRDCPRPRQRDVGAAG